MRNRVKTIIEYAKGFKQLYDANHIAAYSAQAAFFVLLSAVPLVILGVLLLGVLPVGAVEEQFLSQLFIGDTLSYMARLLTEIERLPAVPLLSVTTVFLVWAATTGVRSIAEGIHNIYGSQKRYNIIQLTVRSVLYTFVMLSVWVASLVVLVFASPVEKLVSQLFGSWADVLLLVLNMRNIIFFFAFTLLFAIAYKGLAKSNIKFAMHLPGAAVASAGWILYSFGFSVYIKHFSRYSVLYGSFGAVMLFMLWLYMCMNILLCGALVNRILYSEKCD